MSIHIHREFEILKERVLSLCAVVEKGVELAARALAEGDMTLAKKVLEADHAIDDREVRIEEDCLKILALYQPLAEDLRFIIAIIKMNTDLERIGDLSRHMARSVETIGGERMPAVGVDLAGMIDQALRMLRQSISALLNVDEELALGVCREDELLDAMHRDAVGKITAALDQQSGDAARLLKLLMVSRHIERMGDHMTNIAEDVIYMITGDIVRHHLDQPRP